MKDFEEKNETMVETEVNAIDESDQVTDVETEESGTGGKTLVGVAIVAVCAGVAYVVRKVVPPVRDAVDNWELDRANKKALKLQRKIDKLQARQKAKEEKSKEEVKTEE